MTDIAAPVTSGEISAPTKAPENSWSISLYCSEGSSDKVYHIKADRKPGDLFFVDFQYGPRGGTLKSGTKTSSGPVAWPAAAKLINSLLSEKLRKGYNPTEMAGEVVSYERPEDTGLRPMLLLAVDIDDTAEVRNLVSDDRYVGQQKFNGERRFVVVPADGEIYGANRTGGRVALPSAIKSAMEHAPIGIYDGEQIGEKFKVWDLLEIEGRDLRSLPYAERLEHLRVAFNLGKDAVYFGSMDELTPNSEVVEVARTAWTPKAKEKMLQLLQSASQEGMTFKRMDAAYAPGDRDSGAIKVKFWASLSAIVGKVNDKRSVGLTLLDDGTPINVGNVTIPANYDIPTVGDVVEVRYLYAYPNGGSLYQTGYLGKRTDILPEECRASQRKFKDMPVAGMSMR